MCENYYYDWYIRRDQIWFGQIAIEMDYVLFSEE